MPRYQKTVAFVIEKPAIIGAPQRTIGPYRKAVGPPARLCHRLRPAASPAPRDLLALNLDDDHRAVGHDNWAFGKAQSICEDFKVHGGAPFMFSGTLARAWQAGKTLRRVRGQSSGRSRMRNTKLYSFFSSCSCEERPASANSSSSNSGNLTSPSISVSTSVT